MVLIITVISLYYASLMTRVDCEAISTSISLLDYLVLQKIGVRLKNYKIKIFDTKDFVLVMACKVT